jgi:hypothetical protein
MLPHPCTHFLHDVAHSIANFNTDTESNSVANIAAHSCTNARSDSVTNVAAHSFADTGSNSVANIAAHYCSNNAPFPGSNTNSNCDVSPNHPISVADPSTYSPPNGSAQFAANSRAITETQLQSNATSFFRTLTFSNFHSNSCALVRAFIETHKYAYLSAHAAPNTTANDNTVLVSVSFANPALRRGHLFRPRSWRLHLVRCWPLRERNNPAMAGELHRVPHRHVCEPARVSRVLDLPERKALYG